MVENLQITIIPKADQQHLRKNSIFYVNYLVDNSYILIDTQSLTLSYRAYRET